MIVSAPVVPKMMFSNVPVNMPIEITPSKFSKLTAENPSVVKLNGAAGLCGFGRPALNALSSAAIAGLSTCARVNSILSVSVPLPPS